MMMANIEIKTDEDPDDENYTLVFTRDNKERFFEWTDKGKQGKHQVIFWDPTEIIP
jgi:hypothetical protein